MAEGNKSKLTSTVVCSDGIYNELTENGYDTGFAVGTMPEEKSAVHSLVASATMRTAACATQYKTR